MASSHNNIGRMLAREGRFPEAFAAFDTALAIRKDLAEANPTIIQYTNHLGYSHAFRGWARVRAGQPKEAATDLRKAVELFARDKALDLETRFERARSLALLAGLGGDAKFGVTEAEARTFADESVAVLADAIAAGWVHLAELKDTDFDAVRDREDFQKLLADLEEKIPKPAISAPPLPEKQ